MPSTLFDNAGLAILAYAKVLADGTSTPQPSDNPARQWINSGVTTTLTSVGQYTVTLPGAATGQETLNEGETNDLIFVQPVGGAFIGLVSETLSDPYDKLVNIYDYTGSLVSAEFNVLILRTVTPNEL